VIHSRGVGRVDLGSSHIQRIPAVMLNVLCNFQKPGQTICSLMLLMCLDCLGVRQGLSQTLLVWGVPLILCCAVDQHVVHHIARPDAF
jgi:hypothetical protein